MTTTTDLRQEAALVVTGPPQWGGELGLRQPPGPDATLLVMDRQGHATAFSGKVEYGQGIRSGFSLAIADELDLPLASVQLVLGDTNLVPYDSGTTGSASTREVGIQLRRAAATARRALMALAAERWGVDAASLSTSEGQVFQTNDLGKRVSYADLLQRQDLRLTIPEDTTTKDPKDFLLMGQNAPRTDARARVTGQAKYSQDIVVPGMLHGKVLRPPSYGARLQHVDTSGADRVAGLVMVVQEDDFVAVICEREDTAENALDAIRARWQEDPELPSDSDLKGLLKEKARQLVVLREEGSPAVGFGQADHILESQYFVPYVANAPMEPCAAVASWDDGNLTVWCGDRSPFSVRDELAQAFEMSKDRVRVIAPEVGGSFGTKGSYGVAYEAARLSRTARRPVRVAHSRAEEFMWGTVRPAAFFEIRSGFQNDGKIVAWECTAYHTGDRPNRGQRGADTPYNTPNVRIAVADSESPLRAGSYRSLGCAANHFAREVHIDEIASTLKLDPVELRLMNLSHPRLRRVLQQAVDRFGWESPGPGGSAGRGVALGYDAGSYVAECVELSVERRAARLQRVVASIDCGMVVNPEGVRNQVEGSIIMGMGTALREEVEFDGGRLLNPDFSRYRVPRIAEAPQIEVVLAGDPTTQSTGAGEPGIVTIAAAIANAVYDATGSRIRSLPIIPQLP
jgi:nicotinate dehydrogenase subunit B